MSDLTLNIAASGIEADQAELDTAANNLSNVSTPLRRGGRQPFEHDPSTTQVLAKVSRCSR